jgi:hypothetical protein
MKIETKYSVNDMIWFYLNGKVVEAPIYKVDIGVYESYTTIQYMVNVGISGNIKFESVKEELAFDTKQELIKSL